MNKTHTRLGSRLARAGTAALAIGALSMVAAPAFATPGDGGEGSITVYKLEQSDTTLGANDGTAVDTSGATPLVAGFTACSINGIDLSSSAQWDRLTNITVSLDTSGDPVVIEAGDPATQLSITCGTEQFTDATTGATVFDDLAADAAYVVYESTPAANAVGVAQPTLLTIPYPGNGTGDAWNYNPVIYPKNTVAGSGSTKDAVMVGNEITFTITVPVNPLAAGETYTEFRISDQLADELTYTGGSVTLTGSNANSVTLTSDDYTLTPPSNGAGDNVVLTMTESGLAKLDANIGGTVVLTIKADAGATGTTANEATVTVNGASTADGTGPQVVDPESFYGGAHIVKEALNKGATSNVPLEGAAFDVYTASATATACPATPDEDETRVLTGQTSNAQGETPDVVLAEGKYCVYETVTPAGYKPVQGGMLLTVDGPDSTVTIVNEQIGSAEGDLPSLPLTGGSGTAVLIAAGVALMGISGGLYLARRRRREQEQQEV